MSLSRSGRRLRPNVASTVVSDELDISPELFAETVKSAREDFDISSLM